MASRKAVPGGVFGRTGESGPVEGEAAVAAHEDSIPAAYTVQELEVVLSERLPRWLSWVRRMLRSGAEAEDAVQDAVVDMLRGLHTSRRDKGDLAGWCTRIVHNRAVDRTRRLRAQRNGDEVAATLLLRRADTLGDDPEARYLRAVVRCLPRLTPGQRQVWLMVCGDGLSNSEVAGLLGIGANKVASRLHSARKTLSKIDRQDLMDLVDPVGLDQGVGLHRVERA